MKNFYKKYKKSCITAIVLASLTIFYTLFGFFGIPWLLTDIVPKFIADKNATLSIKEAKFHPYKFELNATEISLKTYKDIFNADKLDVSLNFKEVFSKNINVEIFRLTKPFVNIEREKDLSFNFEPLIASDENTTDKAQDSDKESFFNFTLNSFEIVKGGARYADFSLSEPFNVSLKDLSYRIKDINLNEYSGGRHELGTDSNLFETFDWDGGINLNPLTIYGDIKFSGLKMDKIWQSYMSQMDISVTQGKLDAGLNYRISIDKNGINTHLSKANLAARDFNVIDKNSTVKFADLNITDIEFSGEFSDHIKANGDIDKITLDGFRFQSELEMKLQNFSILQLSYSFDEILNANFNELSLSDFALNSGSDNALLKQFAVKEPKLKFNTTDGKLLLDISNVKFDTIGFKNNDIQDALLKQIDLNELGVKFDTNASELTLDVSGIKLAEFSFKNADMSVASENFYINNTNIDAKNEFKNIAINLPKFGLKGVKFSGFDIKATQPEFSFNNLSLSVNSENNATDIVASLDSFSTLATQIEGGSERLAHLNALSANSLKFGDDSLNLSSFKIGKTDIFSPKKSFAGFNEIGFSDIKFDLKKQALDLKNIKIDGAFFNEEIDENGLKTVNNLAILKKNMDKKPAKTVDKTSQNSTSEFTANIENIQIINAKSNITQNFLSEPLGHNITLKNAKITGFSSDLKKPFDINLNASTGEKISLNLKGKVALDPMKTELDAKINASDLKELNKISKDFINANISGGKLGIDAKFRLDKSYKLNANVRLDEFSLDDENKTRLISLNNAILNDIKLDEKELKISKISVNNPYLRTHIDKDKNLNLAKIVKSSDTNETLSQTKPQNVAKEDNDALKIRIKDIALNDTSIDFSDESLVLPFLFKIRKLNTKLSNIEQGKITDISTDGVIGSGGSANITARIDAFDPKNFSDIALKFKDVELNEATPYSATFVGRKIDSGTIDLGLIYKVENSQLKGDNEVRIDTIKLGENVESPDAMSLPLQLAVSILQDSNNVIKLNLPVSGDLQNPEFSYGGIILQAIMQIFTDVVTSPFRLIGNVLGVGNAEELAKIDFTAGNADVIGSQSKKIDEFKKITDTKKDMRLVITPAYDEIVDKFAVQKRLFDRDTAIAADKRGISQHEIIQEMATRQFKNPPKDAYSELVKLRKIDGDTLTKLAKNRAENLKNAMIKAGISSEQIKIADKIEKTKAQMELYVPLPMGIENK